MQAASQAGSPAILQWLRKELEHGPYAGAAPWVLLLLRSLHSVQGISKEDLAANVVMVGLQNLLPPARRWAPFMHLICTAWEAF